MLDMGMCDRCTGEPAVACNDDGDYLCEDCFFEEATDDEYMEESE